jgi:hypothetical protein
VRATKDSTKPSVVRAFSYSDSQTMVLEFGDLYVRFHTQGATLLRGTVAAYNGATAYTPGDLVSQRRGGLRLHRQACTGNAPPNAAYWYAQPARANTKSPAPTPRPTWRPSTSSRAWTCSPWRTTGYAPRELRRAGATKWYFTLVSFVSNLTPPVASGATATHGHGGAGKVFTYVVTAWARAPDESLPSSTVACGVQQPERRRQLNTVTWSAVTGATRYNVYKLEGGIYGFIGQSSSLSFVDDNIAADTSYLPARERQPVHGRGELPRAVAYHEQRRCFAGTLNQPQNFWARARAPRATCNTPSPPGTDDSLQFKIAARKNQTIRHLVSMQDLLLLTASSEWRCARRTAGR